MAMKKSQLYSSIWQSCDEMRGGMEASQYKDYVLVLLFVRYVSDKYADQKNALVVIPEGGSFSDLVKLKGKTNIGEGINKVLSKLAEANGLKGVIDTVDFSDEAKLGKGKEMQDRLSNLVAICSRPRCPPPGMTFSRCSTHDIFIDQRHHPDDRPIDAGVQLVAERCPVKKASRSVSRLTART
jgi:type I restriction-modification system DNA methylase subunit